MARQPLVGQGLLIIEGARSHSDTPHSVELLRMSQRHLLDNTQHSQETNPGGIRTGNPSKRAAADSRLRPRDHRDRLV